uniref:Phosphoprotein n=1 Tax=Lechcodon virus TaxID=3095318 RepID=A0AAU0QLT6_9MONO
MSYEDRVKQIQNGLEIVDLVKKIRQQPAEKPTYGRSAISAPSTRDRAAAWELFHKSTLDETGLEGLPDEKGDDIAVSGDGDIIQYDIHDANSGGSRTYKESKWDDDDEPVLENKLVTNIQQDDNRRDSSNRKFDNKDDCGENNRQERSSWSDGCTETDQTDMPSILKSSVYQNTNAPRYPPEGKKEHTMNPNAKEYVPLSKQNESLSPENMHTSSDAETPHNDHIYTKPKNKTSTQKDSSIPSVKPRLARQIMRNPMPSIEEESLAVMANKKQRTPLYDLSEVDNDPIPIKLPRSKMEFDDNNDDDDISMSILDIDNDLGISSDTLFDLADLETDNDRRNSMASKIISSIVEDAVNRPGSSEEVIYVTNRPPHTIDEGDPGPSNRKLRALSMTDAGKYDFGEQEQYVKKGTEENTTYPGMDQKSRSKNGAIRSVQKSNPSPLKKNATAENVQSIVKMKAVQEFPIKRTDDSAEGDNSGNGKLDNDIPIDFDDYFDQLTTRLDKEDILKELLRNQLTMLSKIGDEETTINLLRGLTNNYKALSAKVDALDRNIGRLGLAVSSMEQMLASMRIMIPGKPQENDSKPRNPMLKPVISRLTIQPEEVIDIDIEEGKGRKEIIRAKKELFIEPLDSTKTNATQFIPDNSPISKQTLTAIVINRIKDVELRSAFLSKIKTTDATEEIRVLHKNIKEAMNAGL